MSKSKKNNKKSANKNRKNYKIESLEPRLLMDASVNDWNDELNALNVGAYTIDSNSSKIDGLLSVSYPGLLDPVTRQIEALAVLFDEHRIAFFEKSR